MQRKIPSLVVLLGVTGLVFALSLFRLHDDDVGFLVAGGRLVRKALANGEPVPTTNPFSYAVPGHPWTQHQWLPSLAISWLVDDAPDLLQIRSDTNQPDARVLILVKAILYAALFLALTAGMLAEGCPASVAFFFTTLGAVAASPRFYERPYLLSAIGLAMVLLSFRAFSRSGRWRWLLLATVVPVANAHLHAGVWDSILVHLAMCTGAVASWLVLRQGNFPTRFIVAFLASTLGVIGTLLLFAPSGIQVILLPVRMTGNAYWASHLKEFRPLWTAIGPMWPAVVFLVATILVLFWRRPKLDLSGHLLVLGFAILAVKHLRMVLPFVIVSLPIIGQAFAGISCRRVTSSLAAVCGILVGGAGFVIQAERFSLGLGDASDGGIDHSAHPFYLLDRIERDQLPGEVFVSDGLAGTFLWRLYPPRRVLVHTDLEAYPVEVFEDPYQVIRYARDGFEERLRALGIRTFLLKHTTRGERMAASGRPNIRDILWERSGTGRFPDAVLVDFDDAASLWVLRDDLPAGVSTLANFPVNPDTGRPRPGVPLDQVRAALLEHAATHPFSKRSIRILATLPSN